MTTENEACCAHKQVSAFTEEKNGIVYREYWACNLCRLEFNPVNRATPTASGDIVAALDFVSNARKNANRHGDHTMQRIYETIENALSTPAAQEKPDFENAERFVFDPATGFFHADDGGAPEHGVLWVREDSRAHPLVQPAPVGEISDGFHTFNELYKHRHTLFLAVLKCYPDMAWKSKLHDDGTMFDNWFIAGIETPDGQATYHLPIRLWDAFSVKEMDRAPAWDGHTPDDVLNRIARLNTAPSDEKRREALERMVQLFLNVTGNISVFKQPDADVMNALSKIRIEAMALLATPERGEG